VRFGLIATATWVLLLSMSAPVLMGCSRADERPEVEKLVYAPQHDAAVEAATQKALETLPVFWIKKDANSPGYSDFMLKVALPTRHGGLEYIWIGDVRRSGHKIKGTLANEPFDLEGLSVGSEVEAPATQIADWQYEKAGKLYGHFTTRALQPRANAEQQAQVRELFAPTPLEPESN